MLYYFGFSKTPYICNEKVNYVRRKKGRPHQHRNKNIWLWARFLDGWLFQSICLPANHNACFKVNHFCFYVKVACLYYGEYNKNNVWRKLPYYEEIWNMRERERERKRGKVSDALIKIMKNEPEIQRKKRNICYLLIAQYFCNIFVIK